MHWQCPYRATSLGVATRDDFLTPLPAAQVQRELDWAEERSKLGRSPPLGGGGGGAAPGTQHYVMSAISTSRLEYAKAHALTLLAPG